MGTAASLDALLATEAWREVDASFTTAMSEFFQLPFGAVLPHDSLAEPFVAEVSLSEPSRELEIALSIVVDTPSMKRLGAHLLGDDDLEGAQELVLEVANIVMGTLKTSFATEGFAFTGGIPAREALEQSRRSFERAALTSRTAIRAHDTELALWVRVKEKETTIVRGDALREGLVVMLDVRGPCGNVLVPSGTRLTQTAVTMLATLLPDADVDVSDPTT